MVTHSDPDPVGSVGSATLALPAALIEPQLRAWLAEDIGRGDLSAPALAGRQGRGAWFAKGEGLSLIHI